MLEKSIELDLVSKKNLIRKVFLDGVNEFKPGSNDRIRVP